MGVDIYSHGESRKVDACGAMQRDYQDNDRLSIGECDAQRLDGMYGVPMLDGVLWVAVSGPVWNS